MQIMHVDGMLAMPTRRQAPHPILYHNSNNSNKKRSLTTILFLFKENEQKKTIFFLKAIPTLLTIRFVNKLDI